MSYWLSLFLILLLKNSIEYILKTLLALLTDSQIGQHPVQQIERNSEELYKMKAFYRQEGQDDEVTPGQRGLPVARSLSFRDGRNHL